MLFLDNILCFVYCDFFFLLFKSQSDCMFNVFSMFKQENLSVSFQSYGAICRIISQLLKLIVHTRITLIFKLNFYNHVHPWSAVSWRWAIVQNVSFYLFTNVFMKTISLNYVREKSSLFSFIKKTHFERAVHV